MSSYVVHRNLIETIKGYRILYDKSETDFKNQTKKANAWEEVAKAVGSTVGDVKKNFKTVRTVFGKYIASLELPSGSSRADVQLDSEKEHLRWLITYIVPRPTKTSIVPVPTPTTTNGNTHSAHSQESQPETESQISDSDPEGEENIPSNHHPLEDSRPGTRASDILGSDDEPDDRSDVRSPLSVKSASSASNSQVKLSKRKGHQQNSKPWSKVHKKDRDQPSQFEMLLVQSLKTLDESPAREATKDAAGLFADTVADRLRKLSEYQLALIQPKILQLITETQYSTPTTPQHTSWQSQNFMPFTGNQSNSQQPTQQHSYAQPFNQPYNQQSQMPLQSQHNRPYAPTISGNNAPTNPETPQFTSL